MISLTTIVGLIAMVLGVIAIFKGWLDLWGVIVIGGLLGYFSHTLVSIILAIIVIIWYRRKRSDTSDNIVRLIMTIVFIVGLSLGNLTYYVSRISISTFPFQAPSQSAPANRAATIQTLNI